MSCYIYQLPAWVLDDLCRNMDTLSEWDWMHFASYVITDLTQLRKIKSMERVQGVSITRELLWWWGMRQATVQQLLDLLHRLELYRAAQIILNWKPIPEVKSPVPDFPAAEKSERPLAAPRRNPEDGAKEQPVTPATSPDPGISACRKPASPKQKTRPLKGDMKSCREGTREQGFRDRNVSTFWPQPETLLSLSEDSLSWREADVVQATNNFNQNHKIHEGAFADVYRGQRLGTPLIFKKLHEMTSGPGSLTKFFQAEVQLCRRCRHPNVLPLLGFCTGQQFHSLIYPYMANGSLQDRLQGQGDADLLPWPQRVHICSGLLQAVAHLHGLDIIHGNVKSSNVLLDQNFIPKLAHPVTHLCPVNKGSKCTTMKTRLFQASVAYLPEDFLRVGQLTKRVDVFSCGIVLAEVLTGIPAMDNSRSPVYLKDLLLGEIPGGGTSLCSRKTGVERAVAKEICRRYLETRAGHLQEDCAEALATAACLCLRRRNTSLAEVCGWVATVEEQLGGQAASLPCSELSEGTGSSSNTPEETDDVDLSSLGASSCGAAPLPPRTEERETEVGEGRLQAGGGVEADSSSEACASAKPSQDDFMEIEINEAKRKLMENILLYKEEKLDSIELFGPDDRAQLRPLSSVAKPAIQVQEDLSLNPGSPRKHKLERNDFCVMSPLHITSVKLGSGTSAFGATNLCVSSDSSVRAGYRETAAVNPGDVGPGCRTPVTLTTPVDTITYSPPWQLAEPAGRRQRFPN